MQHLHHLAKKAIAKPYWSCVQFCCSKAALQCSFVQIKCRQSVLTSNINLEYFCVCATKLIQS